MDAYNTNCHGSCSKVYASDSSSSTVCTESCDRKFVAKTDNVEDCINICKGMPKCRHFIWHYPHANTVHKSECFVVEVEEGKKDISRRNRDDNTVTGSCNPGCVSIRIQGMTYRVSYHGSHPPSHYGSDSPKSGQNPNFPYSCPKMVFVVHNL